MKAKYFRPLWASMLLVAMMAAVYSRKSSEEIGVFLQIYNMRGEVIETITSEIDGSVQYKGFIVNSLESYYLTYGDDEINLFDESLNRRWSIETAGTYVKNNTERIIAGGYNLKTGRRELHAYSLEGKEIWGNDAGDDYFYDAFISEENNEVYGILQKLKKTGNDKSYITDYYIFNLNKTGDLIWQKQLNKSIEIGLIDFAPSIIVGQDRTVVVAYNVNGENAYIDKYDEQGGKCWGIELAGFSVIDAMKAGEEIYVIGNKDKEDENVGTPMIIVYSGAGEIKEEKTIDANEDEEVREIFWEGEKIIIILGFDEDHETIVEYDERLNDERTIDIEDEEMNIKNISLTKKNEMIVEMLTNGSEGGKKMPASYTVFVKYDQDGKVEWEKEIGYLDLTSNRVNFPTVIYDSIINDNDELIVFGSSLLSGC